MTKNKLFVFVNREKKRLRERGREINSLAVLAGGGRGRAGTITGQEQVYIVNMSSKSDIESQEFSPGARQTAGRMRYIVQVLFKIYLYSELYFSWSETTPNDITLMIDEPT
jgi:hypothetical protein